MGLREGFGGAAHISGLSRLNYGDAEPFLGQVRTPQKACSSRFVPEVGPFGGGVLLRRSF
jgi:hypothetical protein